MQISPPLINGHCNYTIMAVAIFNDIDDKKLSPYTFNLMMIKLI